MNNSNTDNYHRLLGAMIEGAEGGLPAKSNKVEASIRAIIQPCINFSRNYKPEEWHSNFSDYDEIFSFINELSKDICQIKSASDADKQRLSNSLLENVTSAQPRIDKLLTGFEVWQAEYIESIKIAKIREEQRNQAEKDRLAKERADRLRAEKDRLVKEQAEEDRLAKLQADRLRAEEEKNLAVSQLKAQIDHVESEMRSLSPDGLKSSRKRSAVCFIATLFIFIFSSVIWGAWFSDWGAFSPAILWLSLTCVVHALIVSFKGAEKDGVDVFFEVMLTILVVWVATFIAGVSASVSFWLFNIELTSSANYLPIGWRAIGGYLLVFPLGGICMSLISLSALYCSKIMAYKKKLGESVVALTLLKAKRSSLQQQYEFAMSSTE